MFGHHKVAVAHIFLGSLDHYTKNCIMRQKAAICDVNVAFAKDLCGNIGNIGKVQVIQDNQNVFRRTLIILAAPCAASAGSTALFVWCGSTVCLVWHAYSLLKHCMT